MAHILLRPKLLITTIFLLMITSEVWADVKSADCAEQIDCTCHIQLNGEIKIGDNESLKTIAKKMRNTLGQDGRREYQQIVLCLNSPDGGDWYEARKIRRTVLALKISTSILSKSECVSACAYIFISGITEIYEGPTLPERFLHEGAKVGFHSPYHTGTNEPNLKELHGLVSEWIIESFDRKKGAFNNGGIVVAEALLKNPSSYYWLDNLEVLAMLNVTYLSTENVKKIAEPAPKLFPRRDQIIQLCVNVYQWNKGLLSYDTTRTYDEPGEAHFQSGSDGVVRFSKYKVGGEKEFDYTNWFGRGETFGVSSISQVEAPLFFVEFHHERDGKYSCAVVPNEGRFQVCFNCFNHQNRILKNRETHFYGPPTYPWFFVLKPSTPISSFSQHIDRLFVSESSNAQLLNRRLQTLLSKLDFYNGSIDGKWGVKSTKALDEFQKALNTREDQEHRVNFNSMPSDYALHLLNREYDQKVIDNIIDVN